MVDVTGFYLSGKKDNEADAEKEITWAWSDFCRSLKELGHEVRGEPGVTEKSRLDQWKEGFGAKRPPAIWPVRADYNVSPMLAADRDTEFAFRAKHEGNKYIARRAKHSVAGAYACWLDMDDLTKESYEALCEKLDHLEYDALVYSSYNHGRKPGVYKIRLVLRLDRMQTADEIDSVRRGAAELLHVNADKACMGRHTLFYLPAVHPDLEEHAFFEVFSGGETPSVDELVLLDPMLGRELEKIKLQELIEQYNGQAATEEQKAQAKGELDSLANDIRFFVAGPLLRPLTVQATMKIGEYAAAGALDLDAARAQLHAAMTECWHRGLKDTDAKSLATRLKEIDTGLRDGGRRPSLPKNAQQLAAEAALRASTKAERIHLQLLSQRPTSEQLDVGAARELMMREQLAFIESRASADVLCVAAPAGVGKSTSQAAIASLRAEQGLQTVIMAQEHAVADQTRRLLEKGVRSCHKFSALSPPPGREAVRCPRHDELSEFVHTTGSSLRKICATQCSEAETCPALAAAKRRDEDEKEASVLFVSQSGCMQAAEWLENGALMLCDEQPSAWDKQDLPKRDIQDLIIGVAGLHLDDQAIVTAAALKVRRGIEPDISILPLNEVPVDIWRGMTPLEKKKLRQASVLVEAVADGNYEVLETGDVRVWRKSRAQKLLEEHGGIVSDATPVEAALPAGSRVLRLFVKDSAPIERIAVVPAGRDTSRSARSFQASVNTDGEKIRSALARCAFFAGEQNAKRVLFISFKFVTEYVNEQLSELVASLGFEEFATAYHGALRGKNNWQHFDMVYVLGKPLQDRRDLCKHLLGADATDTEVEELWDRMARDDNEQAVARGRPTSRDKPLAMYVDADDALPSGWFEAKVVLANEEPGTLLDRLKGRATVTAIADWCGVTRTSVSKWISRGSVPEKYRTKLQDLLCGLTPIPDLEEDGV